MIFTIAGKELKEYFNSVIGYVCLTLLMLITGVFFWLLFCAWMLVALWFLRRRQRGDIPRAVVSLIAGISLLDALLIAGTGSTGLALLALLGFGATLLFQRYITGT